ncbi:MAG: flagellar biosynthesis protein FlhF [Polyangiaceae bacterium]
MQYQLFRGVDVREALKAVKAAFGPDAVIHSTREVSNGRGGALGATFIEVAATPPNQAQRWPFAEARARAEGRRQPMRGMSRSRDNRTTPTLGLDSHEIERELAVLRSMLEDLNASRPPRQRAFAVLTALGVEGGLARELSNGSARAARRGDEALRGWLRERLTKSLRVHDDIIQRPTPQLIAAVGQTGVGKTTTLAKLAARARLDHGRSVSIISLDTYRVGAVEQWQRYATLMGLPFFTAQNEVQFARCLAECRTDIVLVDTAGRSTLADDQRWIVPACLQSTSGRESNVALVMPAWTRGNDAERAVRAYAEAGVTGLCVTKLDETLQAGGVLHAAMPEDLPFYYLCDGPRVPEDIRPATVNAVVDALFESAP